MDLKSVHAIFNDRILRIPSYQRGYTWSNNEVLKHISKIKSINGQLKDLWDDLMNVDTGNWHYTGLLTLDKVPEEYSWLPNHKQYAIVDGQQRITTILILISVIIELSEQLKVQLEIREGDEKYKYLIVKSGVVKAYIFGYEEDNPSDKYFKKHILNVDEVEDGSKESVYTENLKNAKKFFEIVVSEYIKNDSTKLKGLYALVTTNLRFNEYILPDELDEYVVFETMNNRGKPLSELEKLKNRLMYLNSKLPLHAAKNEELPNEIQLLQAQRSALESAINTSWITVYNSLGANKNRPLNDEEFLRNHWIAYFDRYNRSESEAYSGYLFDQYFILQNVYEGRINHVKIENYIKSLQKASIIWNKLNNPKHFESDEKEFQNVILSLYRVGFKPSFKPIVMAILLRADRNDFIKVIQLLEEYSFKIFHISDRQSNTGDSKLYKLAYQVYQAGMNADLAFATIKQHLDSYYNFNFFKNQVVELFESGERKGFYGWGGRFYFLFEYDQYLRRVNSTSTAASQIGWDDFVRKNTIEHIYPQSAVNIANNNQWSGFDRFSSAERKCLGGCIGNLLAISHSDNSSFNDDPFLFKVDQNNKGEQYKNRGYKYDSMSARIVANELEWTPEKIVDRGIDMLDFLWKKLHPGTANPLTRDSKLELLGLPFLKSLPVENNG